jgi:hypothetical protein
MVAYPPTLVAAIFNTIRPVYIGAKIDLPTSLTHDAHVSP